MLFYQDITKEITTGFGATVLESVPSRHQLTPRNFLIKDRALCEKARQHSQFYTIERLIIILPDQLEGILLAETEVEPGQSKEGTESCYYS